LEDVIGILDSKAWITCKVATETLEAVIGSRVLSVVAAGISNVIENMEPVIWTQTSKE